MIVPGPDGQPVEFDGKRLRKTMMRKTVDYNSSFINMLHNRVNQYANQSRGQKSSLRLKCLSKMSNHKQRCFQVYGLEMNYGMPRSGPETTETDVLSNQTSASTQTLYLPRYIKAEAIFETL